MQLFDNAFSPYAFKVRAVLYGERRRVREARASGPPPSARSSAAGTRRDEVPALEDGEAVIYDSTVICEYLQEFQTDPDPFFSRGRVHWRNDRLEAAVRLGLGPWLLRELETGRAVFSPVP